jgi:hypothetical protein
MPRRAAAGSSDYACGQRTRLELPDQAFELADPLPKGRVLGAGA